MKLLKFSIIICLILSACNSGKLAPKDAAEQACKCMQLSRDNSAEGVQAFKDCNTETTEMVAEYKTDTIWMNEWRQELMAMLKDCLPQPNVNITE